MVYWSDSKEDLARELGAHDCTNSIKFDEAAELQKMGGAKVILGSLPSFLARITTDVLRKATAPNSIVIETLPLASP